MPPRIAAFNHSPSLLKLYETNLSARGYEVLTFRETLTSFMEVVEHQPDLVIIGDARGIGDQDVQLLIGMRGQPQYQHIPVIIASTAPKAQLEELEQLGNLYIITKPFDINMLIQVVNQALNQPNLPTVSNSQISQPTRDGRGGSHTSE